MVRLISVFWPFYEQSQFSEANSLFTLHNNPFQQVSKWFSYCNIYYLLLNKCLFQQLIGYKKETFQSFFAVFLSGSCIISQLRRPQSWLLKHAMTAHYPCLTLCLPAARLCPLACLILTLPLLKQCSKVSHPSCSSYSSFRPIMRANPRDWHLILFEEKIWNQQPLSSPLLQSLMNKQH